ncbi:hypothetical protein SAMN05421770_10654 [Granulicella rosea]|uniref:Toxin-antitoxin system HicB family antitoxin n=1 Tax=Granulicella rosea TaxID=474952 RepID=A0A239L1V9_9BACT|nr:hypothetical protein [Granulicella rosea]SNT24546.1 hypothetical protein SAMN05421770_10654 [Granulicella rosea]
MAAGNVALQLQESLLKEALMLSKSEGVELNQFINVAVAEKISALRTVEYLRERAARADIPAAREILKRAGLGHEPPPEDRLD